MLTDFSHRLAALLTDYVNPVRPGSLVSITADSLAAMPLIEALYVAVLERGGNPWVKPEFATLEDLMIKFGSEDQLAYLDPMTMTMIEQTDALFYILSPINTRSQARVDPARAAIRQASLGPFYEAFFRRSAEGTLAWTVCAWPTEAAAQEANMSLLDYSEFVYNACALNLPDPVAYWRAMHERQERLVAWLQGKDRVEVKGPGIDLTLSIAGRTWLNSSGKTNFPDGEIFTGPVEDSVNGTIAFNYPTVFDKRQLEGVRLTFRDGCVVDAAADRHEDFLLSKLDIDPGARRLGEFAIGTNTQIPEFTGQILFDEKLGGTLHIALGNSYGETGGVNQSAIHWDMVHGMREEAEIRVDGELFYRNGEFVV